MRAVFFDIGGVIVDISALKESVFEAYAVTDRESFWRLFCQESLGVSRGEEPLVLFWQRIAGMLDVQLDDDTARRLWVDDFGAAIDVNQEVVALALALKASYKIGVISNSVAEHSTVLEKMGVYRPFDAVVLSHEVGIAKDDPEIFKLALSRLGVSARDAVFVDDVERFVCTAESCGIKGILFKDAESLGARLQALGF